MNTTTSAPDTVKQTHLLRGILWGIPFGLGLAIVLVLTKVIPFAPAWALGVFVGGIVIGALWSTLGPAKAPKAPPPPDPGAAPVGTNETDAGADAADPAGGDEPAATTTPPPPPGGPADDG